MTTAQAVRSALAAGQSDEQILAMIHSDFPATANAARTLAYYKSEARTAFSLDVKPRGGIAADVRAALAAGTDERAILQMVMEKYPTCVNPRRTLRFYQREARRAAAA
jgi:hypothetical protein